MASPATTFATLRALHLLIGDAIDDIQRVFSQHSLPDPASPSQCSSPVFSDSSPVASPFPVTPPTSFPPTPLSATFPPLRSPMHADFTIPCVDYPPPDSPLVADSPSEQLALHPDAAAAASRIVAACGQMSSIVHKPFLSICDALMGCNISACMRLVEHLHITEILREGEENRQRSQESTAPLSICKNGPSVESGIILDSSTHSVVDARPLIVTERIVSSSDHNGPSMHVNDITRVICSYAGDGYIDPSDLVHVLRLLSTHHILRETFPDTFGLTRISSLLDTGKSVKNIFSNPETKYDGTDGIAAFVGLSTDDLFKTAAYLTEAFTGVQHPTPGSAPNASFCGTATLPSTTLAINDPTPCPSTTRSSSILTHVVYTGDEDVQRVTRSLDPVGPLGGQRPVQPPMTESQSPACLSPDIVERKGHHSGNTIKPEKLPAFNFAFHTNRPYFEWLENGGLDPVGGTGRAACTRAEEPMVRSCEPNGIPGKSYRLERFSKAMMATTGWEAPKAILSGFGWHSLPKGSTIVDVGGGIGSTTMILARALSDSRLDLAKGQDGTRTEEPATARFTGSLPSDRSPTTSDASKMNTAAEDSMNFRFVVQDRPVVTALGIEAWRSQCPEILESGQVVFQDQDFFEPQPPLGPFHQSRYPAVYLLRVVLHDWPDECARRILINLRVASNPETRLLIAEHVLPLACVDEDVDHATEAGEGRKAHEWTLSSVLAHIEGAERALAPSPLLPNLGKASANAYSMDLTMQMTLNGKERTLREFCALTLSAGWRVSRMTRAAEGSLFAYLVCEPIPLPDDAQAIYNAVALSSELSTVVVVPVDDPIHYPRAEASICKMPLAVPLLPPAVLERSSSRCGTPTFGSLVVLPKDEELQSPRARGALVAKKWLKSKGLGVRSVMMQKVEKQREEQSASKGASTRDNDDVHAIGPASPSHVRVWWKKSPSNSIGNTSGTIHELSGEAPASQGTGRSRKGTLKSSDAPSTPSPRILPVHQKWPSIESVALPNPEVSPSAQHSRRPSVASITRKLSFASFRKPSIVIEPLPTPPPSATFTGLAPPPNLDGDTRRSLKHLPSLPTLGRSEATANTEKRESAIPRRPSFNLMGHVPPPQHVLKAARRPDVADSPKSGILKMRSSYHLNKRSSQNVGQSTECVSSYIGEQSPRNTRRSAESSQRQRRVTLSNSEPPRARKRGLTPGGVNEVSDDAVKVVPSVPRMPRRLSIPMLRRKQSQSVIQDGESRGSPD